MSKEIVKSEVVKDVQLSDAHKQVAKKIQGLLSKTAQTIVEIGTLMNDTLKEKQKVKGYKSLFYKEIGMSERSAQRYMQIAKNTKVLTLHKKNELEGKTMTDLIVLISSDGKSKSEVTDIKKVANGFYTKYKSKPDTLKEIIVKLEELIEKDK